MINIPPYPFQLVISFLKIFSVPGVSRWSWNRVSERSRLPSLLESVSSSAAALHWAFHLHSPPSQISFLSVQRLLFLYSYQTKGWPEAFSTKILVWPTICPAFSFPCPKHTLDVNRTNVSCLGITPALLSAGNAVLVATGLTLTLQLTLLSGSFLRESRSDSLTYSVTIAITSCTSSMISLFIMT